MYLTTFDPFNWNASGRVIPVDGLRRENDVLLRFDVPGIDPKTIEVTVERGVLTVSAKREEEHADGERFFVRERPVGTFTRRVRLSERLNADAVAAAYSNGVLEVRIPVSEQAKPRKVEIRQADTRELAS
jgi:HSP20 family protein